MVLIAVVYKLEGDNGNLSKFALKLGKRVRKFRLSVHQTITPTCIFFKSPESEPFTTGRHYALKLLM